MFKILVLVVVFHISLVSSELTLPLEPLLPHTVCNTLTAELAQKGGLLPNAADSSPDTKRIQAALNTCKEGEAVKLTISGGMNAFLSGPLTLPSGVTLWVDKNVTLFASRNPKDFNKLPGNITCGIIAAHSTGCTALVTANDTKNSRVVGDGIIDGRGGSILIGQNKSWWNLGLDATYNRNYDGGWQNNPRLIQINKGNNFTLYRITLHNGPMTHVEPSGVNGFIAWGVKIRTPTKAYPKYDAKTTKNTNGIDLQDSSNVVIAYSYISTGDDNVAITSNSMPSSNILIAHNHFYRGHGMSIGSRTSKGVNNVVVRDLSLDLTDNGLQIKSDSSCGGLVSGIRYEQICMRTVDSPLVFDAYYSANTGSLFPDFQDIELSGVHILHSDNLKQLVFRGYDAKHPLRITLDNVFSDVPLNKTTASDAYITIVIRAVANLIIRSKESNVLLLGKDGQSTPVNCSEAFVPFPS